MNLNDLPKVERSVVEWQFGLCGDFMSAIWKAISLADEENLARLQLAFPTQVLGYKCYTRTPGWWDRVRKMIETCEAAS